MLLVNHSTQTMVTYRENEKEYFEYVKMIADKAGNGCGKRALILGLGGGSVATVLAENGFSIDAVELDERMAYAAKQFFNLHKKVNVFIDDARHFFIKRPNRSFGKKYDLIILDAFIGESNPHHLFTKEFFTQVKSSLADDGIFFINGNGYWNGKTGMGTRSVCKTLLASGFNVKVLPTSNDENYRNILLEAAPALSRTRTISGESVKSQDLESAIILEDEKPCLEILNAGANKKWREACMKYFRSDYYSGQDKMLFK
jgi:spermidine synthase